MIADLHRAGQGCARSRLPWAVVLPRSAESRRNRDPSSGQYRPLTAQNRSPTHCARSSPTSRSGMSCTRPAIRCSTDLVWVGCGASCLVCCGPGGAAANRAVARRLADGRSGGHDNDRPAASRIGRPRRAGALGRGPDHRCPQPLRDRHAGGTNITLHDPASTYPAAATARRQFATPSLPHCRVCRRSCANRWPGTRARRWRCTARSARRWACRCSSARKPARGSDPATRTL